MPNVLGQPYSLSDLSSKKTEYIDADWQPWSTLTLGASVQTASILQGNMQSLSKRTEELGASVHFAYNSVAARGSGNAAYLRATSSTESSLVWTFGAERVGEFEVTGQIPLDKVLSESGRAELKRIKAAFESGDTTANALYNNFCRVAGDGVAKRVRVVVSEAVTYRRDFSSSRNKQAFSAQVEGKYGAWSGDITFSDVRSRLGVDTNEKFKYLVVGRSSGKLSSFVEQNGEPNKLNDIVAAAKQYLDEPVDWNLGAVLSVTVESWASLAGFVVAIDEGNVHSLTERLLEIERLEHLLALAPRPTDNSVSGELEVLRRELTNARSATIDSYRSMMSGGKPSPPVRLPSVMPTIKKCIDINKINVTLDAYEKTPLTRRSSGFPTHWKGEVAARLNIELPFSPDLLEEVRVRVRAPSSGEDNLLRITSIENKSGRILSFEFESPDFREASYDSADRYLMFADHIDNSSKALDVCAERIQKKWNKYGSDASLTVVLDYPEEFTHELAEALRFSHRTTRR